MKKVELKSDMVIYQREDGTLRIEVRFKDETAWLSQAQLIDLFQSSKANISEHIKNIYAEKELVPEATVRNFRTVQKEGNREVSRDIEYYNLDMIISLGYRVKSQVATHFRQWATARLREYIVKGFTMDDDRLKDLGGGGYWKELQKRFYGTQYIYWIKAHVERCDSSEKLSQSKRITCVGANSFWVSRLCRASSGKRSSDEDEGLGQASRRHSHLYG